MASFKAGFTAPTLEKNTLLIGCLFVFISAMAFSAKAIFIKLAYAYPVDAVTLLALRMLIAAPFFVVMAIFSSQNNSSAPLTIRDWFSIVTLGLIGMYLSSLFNFMGLAYISAGMERTIFFIYPTFVVLISAVIAAKPIGRREILALVLSWSGIMLIAMHEFSMSYSSNTLLGASLVLLSAVTYACYIVGSGHVIHKIGTQRFTGFSMLFACIASIGHFMTTHALSSLNLPLKVYELGFGMAVISMIIPVFLLNAGIRRIGSNKAALIASTGPISTLLMAAIFLNELISLRQILGTGLVLAGVLSITMPLAKAKEVSFD